MDGSIQYELGQKKFTELIRYAYERGIRFFDTADNYGEMREMLAIQPMNTQPNSYTMKSYQDPERSFTALFISSNFSIIHPQIHEFGL